MPPNNPNTPPASPPPLNHPAPPLESDISNMLNQDEHVIAVIHRHIIGMIIIYVVALGAVLALLALIILSFPTLFSDLSTEGNILVTAGTIFATALVFFMLFIATYIYRQNKLIITNKNIIQILQRGLFSRKISRLDFGDVEDVTAEYHGILPNLFNFGTLNVETSGEQKNFVFPYCPDANKYADIILDARQREESDH